MAKISKGCVTIGYGVASHMPKGGTWHFIWLPKGYGPTVDDKFLCALHDFDSTSHKHGFSKGERHPLVEAIAKVIEEYMISLERKHGA